MDSTITISAPGGAWTLFVPGADGVELWAGRVQSGTRVRRPLVGWKHMNEIPCVRSLIQLGASVLIGKYYRSVCSPQFDNLSAAHETTKLEIEASHSEKVELLKKTYETSISGKGAPWHFSRDVMGMHCIYENGSDL